MADLTPVRLLIFQVGDLTCAVPVEAAREIVPVEAATRIPGAGAAVQGLVNVRGGLLTVVDGQRLLDRPSAGAAQSVIVLETGGRTVGLAVDRVLDLVALPAAELQDREALPGLDPRLVRAVGRRDDRLFVVLDTDALLAPVMGG
ncbi:MAG TPA: chemotaxis protein CheW [Gemmatimonadales bacterium]|jgi:purine-binding chemotaxis protein CheW|nr:chemotaxis protein CheW [Gemmatimonadales bacterium]